ncbi:hypothetical protein CARUB_v10005015mg [Capsella rubella]|uniref:Ubiquitin-like protease family profile domain-containing protein n=1 Tax=Capsella rubella TaxID=81985 RepID=R0GWU9_9BRAS|nr:putative ubiquitin-like-specific protease 1B isoform X2 [Capsella rubella]EOA16795.1 hypothetical protein CARUB_v10005015mg [Capsella rubella]
MAVVLNHGSRNRNRNRRISLRHSSDLKKKRTISGKPVSNTTTTLSLRQEFHTCSRGFLRFKLWVRASVLLKKKAARHHPSLDHCSNHHNDSQAQLVEDDDDCSNHHNDSQAQLVEDDDGRIHELSSTDGFSPEPFLPLKEEEVAQVKTAFSETNRMKIMVSHNKSRIEICGEALQCLMPTQLLNDEVINLYLELLKERETSYPQKYSFVKCHFFNTFFYVKLVRGSGYNYEAVRRWTSQKRLGYDLIDCDMIFVPIHNRVHWSLAVINNKERKFMYLDSLNAAVPHPTILNALAKYLVDEVKDKNGYKMDITSWDMEYVKELPQQQNWFDCGMFMLKYIDFYSRGLSLQFSQKHMPYFRLRTAKEILNLRAD